MKNLFDENYENMFNEETELAAPTPVDMDALVTKELDDIAAEEAAMPQIPLQQDPVETQMPAPAMQESKPLSREDLLATYRSLKGAQDSYGQDLSNLAMLQGANQIAQGFARGYGANIDDGSKGIEALKAASKEKVDAVGRKLNTASDTMKAQSQLMGLEEEEKMSDPNSDISKLYREQAYALLKRMNPESPLMGKLDDMSASQLQKLGFKGMTNQQQAMPFSVTDRILPDGTPTVVDKRTGQYINALTGEPIAPNQMLARDVARRDAMTGQYGLMYGGQMNVRPTNYEGVAPSVEQIVTPEGKARQKPRDIPYSELMKVAPQQDKEFTAIKNRMMNDMKEPRDIASSVTNLSSKLNIGKNNINEKIDSGNLGGIQTQAAKMAGQKGVLTDQDLVKFAGAGGVLANINRIIDGTFFGEMSEADIKFFKRFADLMSGSLEKDIENRAQVYVSEAQQRADAIFPGIDEKNIKNWLGVDKIAPVVQKKQPTQNKPKAGSVVTVKGKQYKVAEDGDTLIPLNK